MGYYPQESLYKPYKYHGYTVRGTPNCPLRFGIFVSNPGKERLFEFIAALTDQPVPGSQARAVHSSGGAAGGVVSESQGFLGFVKKDGCNEWI